MRNWYSKVNALFGRNPQNLHFFDLDTLPQDVRAFHEKFLNYAISAAGSVREMYASRFVDSSHMTRVEAAYIDSRAFNAFALTRNRNHLVALNISIPSILHFCFNNVMRQPDMMPHIGDPAAEKPYRDRFDHGVPLELPPDAPIAESVRLLPGISRPTSDARAAAAIALCEMATAFCVLHEVSHVVCGHTGFSEVRLTEQALQEFSHRRKHLCGRKLLRQVWEREADIMAAVMVMSFIRTDPGTHRYFMDALGLASSEVGPKADSADIMGKESDYALFPYLLFALKVLFLYLAQLPKSMHLSSFHPHPLVRATYIHNNIRITARDDLGLDVDRLDSLLDAATDSADTIWFRLGGDVPAYRGKKTGPELAEQVREQIEFLEDRHRELQQRYAIYSWVPSDQWKEHGPG